MLLWQDRSSDASMNTCASIPLAASPAPCGGRLSGGYNQRFRLQSEGRFGWGIFRSGTKVSNIPTPGHGDHVTVDEPCHLAERCARSSQAAALPPRCAGGRCGSQLLLRPATDPVRTGELRGVVAQARCRSNRTHLASFQSASPGASMGPAGGKEGHRSLRPVARSCAGRARRVGAASVCCVSRLDGCLRCL